LVQWQKKNWDNYKEKETSRSYWDWISSWSGADREDYQMNSEPRQANPDSVAFEERYSDVPPFSFDEFAQFLTPKQYFVVNRRFREKESFAEIARKSKITASTVRFHYDSALKKITKYLNRLANNSEIH